MKGMAIIINKVANKIYVVFMLISLLLMVACSSDNEQSSGSNEVDSSEEEQSSDTNKGESDGDSLDEEEEILIEKNVVFGKTDKENNLTADVYRPNEGEDLPVVLLIHGGAFTSGSKEMYEEWGPYLAQSGFVAVAINYRLYTPEYSTWPGVLEDVKTAANWVVSNANDWDVEPQRMGVIGDSAGGSLANLLAFQSASNSSYNIRGAVSAYGVKDFEKEPENYIEMFGKDYQKAPHKYQEASPIDYIDEASNSSTFDTSFLVMWGENDTEVRTQTNEEFSNNLDEVGIDVEAIEYPDVGHFWLTDIPGLEKGTLDEYPNTEAAPKILGFLEDKLINTEIKNFSPDTIENLKEREQDELSK
ncbi:alpha/beta hydrolase [Salicibibacter kimchii]|uniref:alpha/beta hydrolase n=1 Tax=Salicibibacter kimchii TaxID=2099786 RepID=UPI001D04E19B|nr:alpha/beta hydrolase [Salicibibacter kimchii]